MDLKISNPDPGMAGTELYRKSWTPLLVIVLFLLALVYARQVDSFRRINFSMTTGDGRNVPGMAVLPKLPAKYPLIVYLYASGGSLQISGTELRQIAELGIGAVSIDYDFDNQPDFDKQFGALQQFLSKQSWARNEVVWMTSGDSFERALTFAMSHTNSQPGLFIGISSGKAATPNNVIPNPSGEQPNSKTMAKTGNSSYVSLPRLLHCPFLLVHGQNDSLFTSGDCSKLSELLGSLGAQVSIVDISACGHSIVSEHPSVLRALAEYCAAWLPAPEYNIGITPGTSSEAETREFNRKLQRARGNQNELWQFLGEAAASDRPKVVKLISSLTDETIGRLTWSELNRTCPVQRTLSAKKIMFFGIFILCLPVIWKRGCRLLHIAARSHIKPSARPSFGLSVVAILTFIGAALFMSASLILPHLTFTEFRLKAACLWLSRSPPDHAAFLAGEAGSNHATVGVLLENADLALLQRNQFYKNLDEDSFRKFILSAKIDSGDCEWGWRKLLYENFQPRIRKEHDPATAAKTIVEYLRQRIEIDPANRLDPGITAVWKASRTNIEGFEKIYVATLRSAGIAARLNSVNHAELWTGNAWEIAPDPPVLHISF